MSETLPDGAMRIVLTWRGTADFDAHLEIPVYDSDDGDSDKDDSTHLFYQVDQGSGNAQNFTGKSTTIYHIYNGDSSDYVTLDQDNTHGVVASCPNNETCGPETITISKVLSSGAYRFHVQAFDQKGRHANGLVATELSDNGTVVQVFYDDQSYNFDVPRRNGDLWTVFDFDNRTGFKQLNYMRSTSDPMLVDNF